MSQIQEQFAKLIEISELHFTALTQIEEGEVLAQTDLAMVMGDIKVPDTGDAHALGEFANAVQSTADAIHQIGSTVAEFPLKNAIGEFAKSLEEIATLARNTQSTLQSVVTETPSE
jgi:hypothetical protein